MNETLFEEDRDILMRKLSGRHVDTETLLSVTPKEIAAALLIRRKALNCLLYTSPSPRDATLSRMPSSA